MDNRFGPATGLTFASWMAFAIPVMTVNLFLSWGWLYFQNWFSERRNKKRRSVTSQLLPFSFKEMFHGMVVNEIINNMKYIIGKWRWAFWRRSSKWWKRKADKKGHERKTWGVRTDDVPWNKRLCMFCHRHRSLVLQKTFVYARYTIFKWIYAFKKGFNDKQIKTRNIVNLSVA